MQKNPQNHSFSIYFNSDFEDFIYDINIFSFTRNLILQSRIYLFKVEFTFSIHQTVTKLRYFL